VIEEAAAANRKISNILNLTWYIDFDAIF